MKELEIGDDIVYISKKIRYDFTYGKKYKILEKTYELYAVRYWLRDDEFQMRSFFKSSNLIPNFFILNNELRRQKLKKLKNNESKN